MLSDQVQTAIISTIGGIIIAYIVNVAAKRVQLNRQLKQPKDRVEQLFDGYERALKQKDQDNAELRALLQDAQRQLGEVRDTLSRTDEKLTHSKQQNIELQASLDRLRNDYKTHKND